MNICIFEDGQFTNFYPLSLSRPIYQLKCGIYTLAEKIRLAYPKARFFYYCRDYLKPLLKKQGFKVLRNIRLLKSCLFINGRVVANQKISDKIKIPKVDTLYYFNNELVAAYLSGDNLKLVKFNNCFLLKNNRLNKMQVKVNIINYIWDIVHLNEEELINDSKMYGLGTIQGTVYPNVSLVNKKNIFIGKNTKIKPGVVIDAENGPVIIEKNCEIMSNGVIIGPAYIGPNCKIKAGAKIYNGTSIGQVSKIGGEVESTMIHGYSNKQHEGFLGHSYIGSWCNLGADTNNSDLKNNYSPVDIVINGKKMDTGHTFVGLFMGDHSKSGINTMFNTGSVVGFSSNVFGSGYLPKHISSFSWFDNQRGNETYKIDKAIEVAKKVMSRRRIKFSATDKNIFQTIFNLTKK